MTPRGSMSSILRLVILILLVACQAEGEKSNTLVANHQQTNGQFSLTLPTNGNYLSGQSLDFTLSFPYPINVNGSPRIALTIGSTTRYAELLSGSGTQELYFRYVVQTGDEDANGISVASNLDLNGASLTFTGTNGTQTPPTGFSVPASAGIIVDTTSPTLSFATPAGGMYLRDMPITFTATASEPVFVTGTPRASLTIGGVTRYANYVSGSGTSSLLFRYTVANPDFDTDGISKVSPVQLNGGSIRDRAGNLVSLSFTPPDTSSVLVNGVSPYVKSVILPNNGTYTFNQSIDVKLRFNEAVAVSGLPSISINVGGVSKNMAYIGGSTTTDLTFRYVVQTGDVDTDGISLGNVVSLNGGAILNAASVAALPGFVAPLSPGIQVSAPAPRIVNFTWTDGTYLSGQTVTITAIFDRPVTVTGSPRIAMNVGGITRYLSYDLGSGTSNIRFSYSVIDGDADTDGVQIQAPLEINGGLVRDANGIDAATAFTAPSTPGLQIQSDVPVIVNVIPPADGNYTVGQALEFSVVYDENVSVIDGQFVNLNLNIGEVNRQASYVSGSGTTTLLFRYTVQPVDSDLNGIGLLSPISVSSTGRIRDIFNNNAAYNFLPPTMPNVQVNAGLIAPTIVNVAVPANATYKIGDQLNFQVQFSEFVFTSGTPRIALTVGASTKYATYVSGTGSDTLVFRYTVDAGDFDNNGITSNPTIDLNGGTITDTDLMNSSLTLSGHNLTGVNVDGVAPTLGSVVRPVDGSYNSGDTLDFTATFSEPVNVIGTPRVSMTIGSTIRYATYVSGAGSSTIVFRYTIQAGDDDSDGITHISPLDLNGGTIRDLAGNSSTLSFVPNNAPGINVTGTAPTIVAVTGPAVGSYGLGTSLNFTLTTSTTAVITGTPRIALTIGSLTRYANYQSGSGTTTLEFSYTVQAGDNDIDGITALSPVELNSGTFKTSGSADFVLNFTAPNTNTVFVDTTAPILVSVTAPIDNNYNTSSNLDFIAQFSEVVTVSGTPRLALNFNGTTVFANYLNGSGSTSLTFRRTVVMGDFDNDGIGVMSPLQLNSGNISDAAANTSSLTFTPPNTSGITINQIIPTITNVTAAANGVYGVGAALNFSFTMSETAIVAGTPRLAITIGGTTITADYFSGSGSNVLTFRYNVQSGNNDNDGITVTSPLDQNGGTIRNGVGTDFNLTFAVPNTSGVIVDTSAPTISTVIPPANQTYGVGSQLDFFVNFSETVTVTATPRISIDVGGTSRFATYVSGSGTSSLLFRYTVVAGDNDTDGIGNFSPIDLNGGTIRDAAANAASLTFSTPNTSAVLVDTIAPTITSVTASANGTYNASQFVALTVTLSETVIVGGSPRIALTVGATTRYADYFSGTGSNTLVFRYVPTAGDLDMNGIATASTIDLNLGSLHDPANNNAVLTFTAPNTSGINVDTVGPTITSITPPAPATYAGGQNMNFTVNFSENVTVAGFPRIAMVIGFATKYATYVSGSGSTALLFRYTVATGDLDSDGITLNSPLDLNGGTLRDAATNSANLTFTAPNTTGVRVDAVLPEISSIDAPGNGIYKTGAGISFTVNFTKPVTVTGTPRIALSVGSVTAYTTTVTGSGTTSLTMTFTPDATHLDLNGIAISGTSLELNGGTIRDANSTNANLAYPALPNLSGVVVLYTAITSWYDLNDSSSLTLAASGPDMLISQVTDKVGTVHLTAAGGARPIHNAAGFGSNGTGRARFTGTQSFTWNAPVFQSFVMVYKSQTSNLAHTMFNISAGGGPDGRHRFQVNNNATITTVSGATTSSTFINGNAATTTSWAWTPNTPYVVQTRWSAPSNAARRRWVRLDSTGTLQKYLS